MANPSSVPRFSPTPRFGDFFVGFGLPLQAARLIRQSAPLRRLTLLCTAVTFVSLVAVIALAWKFSPDLVSIVFPRPANGGLGVLWQLAVALTFLVLVALGANTVPLLLLAPLQDPLSEATEAICGDFTPPPFTVGGLLRGTGVAIAHTLARVLLMFAGVALLFPINFIPGAGSIAWTIAGSAWAIFWLATEYLDGAMARHLYRFGDVTRAVRARLGLGMGLGAAIYLLLWVPVLNLFFVPLAIVSGTLLYRGLRSAGALAPPPAAP